MVHNKICSISSSFLTIAARNSYQTGRISTVDLLVLTSSDQLLLIMEPLFPCFTKQDTRMSRSTVLSLPLQLVFPASTQTGPGLVLLAEVLSMILDKICNISSSLLTIAAKNAYQRGRISTVDLLVLTISDQLLLILEPLFLCFTKLDTRMSRSTVLSLPLHLVFPACTQKGLGLVLLAAVCPWSTTRFAASVQVFSQLLQGMLTKGKGSVQLTSLY
jgi:hypothetical protein